MCGFIGVFSKDQNILEHFEKNQDVLMHLVSRRGPDKTIAYKTPGVFICHSLLAINDYVTQPVENDEALLFMNGEIYNDEALSSKNDTEWLLQYLSDKRSLQDLDGEFIVTFYNKKEEIITVISDPFATKPCFLVIGANALIVSSYHEPLVDAFGAENIHEFPPNFQLVYSLKDSTVINQGPIVNWDFEPKSNSFDDWQDSFSNAIKKRTTTDKQIFLGLSSGYDSGAIVCEMLKQHIPFTSYSIFGAENKETLQERINLVNSLEYSIAKTVEYDQKRYDDHLNFLRLNCSNYAYHSVQGEFIKWMLDDKAAVGLSMICEDAKEIKAKIYFSGQGADEIFSDYATRGPHHGTIRGNFTHVRSKWTNFDQGFQRNFLSKEERVPGTWGIEARYPFLDKDVVQNFLWLSDDLKNSEYKQCIAQFLRKNKFPFDENQKCGFNPLKSLPKGKILYGNT